MQSSKTFLFVFPSSQRGGSELCTIESIRELQAQGYKCYCALPSYGAIYDELISIQVICVIVPYDWWVSPKKWNLRLRLKMIKGFLFSAYRIFKYIRGNSIGCVVSVTTVTPVGALAAFCSSTKHIWYIHEYVDLDHGLSFNYGKRFTYWVVNLLSTKIITISESLKEYLSTFLKKEIVIVPNMANYIDSLPTKREIDILSIVMVGRISEGKNQLLALKALGYLIYNQGRKAKMTFVGNADNEYLNILNNFIFENHLKDYVNFVGYSISPEIYVQQSDCVLVCSRKEAFGRVTIEAMKAGKLAIVSNSGAGAELVIDGVTGYLFNYDDGVELGQCLMKAYNIDKKYEIEKKAYAYANKYFTSQNHLQKLLEALK